MHTDSSSSNWTFYRVIEPFAASNSDDGRFLTVRKGTLLTLEGPLKVFGLVEVVCGAQRLLVFTRDIETCAERLVRPRNG